MAPDPERRTLSVPPELDGERLDRALAQLVADRPRTRLREMVEDGRVTLAGQACRRPSLAVRAGEVLVVELVERDRSRAGSAPSAELPVLHADEHLIVVAKPAGMVSHPGPTVRGGTVAEICEERFGPLPNPQGGPPGSEEGHRPGIVHRLDAETSGVMVLGRSEEACAELMRQFKERLVEKRYLALVHGSPRFDTDWIEAPLGRSPRGDRMAIQEDGRPATTWYEVRERFRNHGYLMASPKTGRTHQIRVHLASIGLPVMADKLYVGSSRGRRETLLWPRGAPRLERHALHAERLTLRHPATREPLTFAAPLPPDLEALLAWLREHDPTP